MIGRKLVAHLVGRESLGGRHIDRVTLLDIVPPARPDGFAGKVEPLPTISAAKEVLRPWTGAARCDLPSSCGRGLGEAERDFEKGMHVNFDYSRALSKPSALLTVIGRAWSSPRQSQCLARHTRM